MSTTLDNQKGFSILDFYTKNQKNVQIGLGVVVALVAGFIYYSKVYMPAQEDKASSALYYTQRYFEKDSMDFVLNGDGKNQGAIDIADEYGSTKSGNLAKYYAGRAYMSKGDYKNALSYLKKTSFDDQMLAPLTIMLIGDCQVELDQFEDAASSFMKAATMRKNDFSAPMALMKAGRTFEKLNKWEKALKAYELLKKEYKDTEYGNNIDKYIYRAKTKTEA
jgi:predicted negative regulator of RcsB-dependent stress response